MIFVESVLTFVVGVLYVKHDELGGTHRFCSTAPISVVVYYDHRSTTNLVQISTDEIIAFWNFPRRCFLQIVIFVNSIVLHFSMRKSIYLGKLVPLSNGQPLTCK